jgi:phytoene/squalene synthetase
MDEAELLAGKPVEGTVPFALWLLPVPVRMRAMALYRFARGLDDLVDDPVLSVEAKDKVLRAIRQALENGEVQGLPVWAREFGQLHRRKLVKTAVVLDLLNAMEEDVEHRHLRDYESLLAYARMAAAPVGRMALELLDEEKADVKAADALCIALQLLNVVRDASKDYLVLKRVYLPGDWLQQGGVPLEDFTHTQLTPRLRGTMQRVLDRAAAFLDAARPLPASIRSRQLRVLLRAVMIMARMLHAKLSEQNPLAGRVHLGRLEQFQAIWQAVLIEFLPARQGAANAPAKPAPSKEVAEKPAEPEIKQLPEPESTPTPEPEIMPKKAAVEEEPLPPANPTSIQL